MKEEEFLSLIEKEAKLKLDELKRKFEEEEKKIKESGEREIKEKTEKILSRFSKEIEEKQKSRKEMILLSARQKILAEKNKILKEIVTAIKEKLALFLDENLGELLKKEIEKEKEIERIRVKKEKIEMIKTLVGERIEILPWDEVGFAIEAKNRLIKITPEELVRENLGFIEEEVEKKLFKEK